MRITQYLFTPNSDGKSGKFAAVSALPHSAKQLKMLAACFKMFKKTKKKTKQVSMSSQIELKIQSIEMLRCSVHKDTFPNFHQLGDV